MEDEPNQGKESKGRKLFVRLKPNLPKITRGEGSDGEDLGVREPLSPHPSSDVGGVELKIPETKEDEAL